MVLRVVRSSGPSEGCPETTADAEILSRRCSPTTTAATTTGRRGSFGRSRCFSQLPPRSLLHHRRRGGRAPPAVTPEPLPRALPASGLLLLRRRHRGGLLSQAHGISSRAPASRSATALTRARAVAAATPPHDTAACTGLPRAIVLRRQAEVLEIFLAESAGRRAPREGRSGAVILRRGTTASTCKRKKSIASDACGRGQICEEKNTTGKEGVLGGTVDALLTGLA